jgi:hypothetical protein
MRLKGRRLLTAGRIFRHPLYIAIAAVSTILFFYLFRYLIAINNHGIFLLLMPMYIVYLLVLTSGVLFSISLFAIAHSVASRRLGEIGGIEGLVIPSLGGLVASCGCAFPLLESIFLFFGVNTFEAVGIVSVINSYQLWILGAMIFINLATIYYYLGKVPMGPAKKRRR